MRRRWRTAALVVPHQVVHDCDALAVDLWQPLLGLLEEQAVRLVVLQVGGEGLGAQARLEEQHTGKEPAQRKGHRQVLVDGALVEPAPVHAVCQIYSSGGHGVLPPIGLALVIAVRTYHSGHGLSARSASLSSR